MVRNMELLSKMAALNVFLLLLNWKTKWPHDLLPLCSHSPSNDMERREGNAQSRASDIRFHYPLQRRGTLHRAVRFIIIFSPNSSGRGGGGEINKQLKPSVSIFQTAADDRFPTSLHKFQW